MAKKNSTPKTIETIRHKDRRANIPTEELRDFVADEEQSPGTALYAKAMRQILFKKTKWCAKKYSSALP